MAKQDTFLASALRFLFGNRLFPLLLVFFSLVGVWSFVEIADEVTEGETRMLDERVLLALRNPADRADPIGPKWVEEVGRDLTALGGVAFLSVLTSIVCGYLLLRRSVRACVFLIAATAGAVALSQLLKAYFAIPRPDIVAHLSHVQSYSFPSGHSMLSAAVFLTDAALLSQLTRNILLRGYFVGVALFLSFLAGISRIYLGVHYLTDVLAGWTMGLGWGLSCWLVIEMLQTRGMVEEANGD